MRLSITWRLLWLVALCAWLAGCGDEARKEDEDSGGDHIPDDEVYTLASLPSGVETTGLAAKEVGATFLRRFVRFAPRYNVCLAEAEFDDEAFQRMTAWLARRSGKSKEFGLEAVINRALATVDMFKSGAKPAVGRIEVELVRPGVENGSCHALITSAWVDEFPFNHEDFAGKKRVLIQTNRLRTESGTFNRIPVGYLDRTLTGKDVDIATQYLIGAFIGLGESSLGGSYLNASTSAASTDPGYFLENDDGSPRLDADAQVLYGFALTYRDVIKTRDLDSLHHYQDQLASTDADQDPDLVMPGAVAPLEFVEAIGDAYVRGARRIGDALPICVSNVSGANVTNANLLAYLDFVDPDAAGSVINYLATREPAIKTKAAIVTTSCSLLIVLKNSSQYPFTEKDINGLYAHEGSVKTKAGKPSTLPVIYLNAASLDLDPTASGASTKPLKLVLQHEFAHFLGLKHSTSDKSILSPAGYNATWDEAGGDGAIFDAFVRYWQE